MILIPSEQLRAALRTAPPAIQDAYLSERTSDVIFELKQRFKLHVDATGQLGSQVGYMLLGLMNPTEFFGNLVLAGIDEKTAREIMDAINTQIFLPLREEMRNPKPESSEGPEIVATVPDEPAATPPAAEVPERAKPLMPAMKVEYVLAETTLPGSPVVAPMPPSFSLPVFPTTIADKPEGTPHTGTMEPSVSAKPIHQTFHTMPNAVHQPGWHPAAAVHIYVPSQAHGQQQADAPQALPVAVPVQNTFVPTPVPSAITSQQHAENYSAPASSIQKEFGADPYREAF